MLACRRFSLFAVAFSLACLGGLTFPAVIFGQADPECVAIPRRLPPVGLTVPQVRLEGWNKRLENLHSEMQSVQKHPNVSDAAVLLKSCELAIQHREFYNPKDFAKIDRVLDLAQTRIAALASDGAALSWAKGSGLQVRGFESQVDGSAQPVGLELPKNWEKSKRKLPLYVWLHGRGDKVTDLHFICQRLDRAGQIHPKDAIVMHPFGRQCVGFKSAGETDVMEAIAFVCENYPVDQDRIVLMGFSMGGAGVWHLAAHYADRFVAASPGAGFAETAKYQRLAPDKFPPRYEQLLWSVYDVPGYTRNLFNLPLVAYSGEVDKQIQAARVMEEAFKTHGRQLQHLIGPGMGHKYHPDTLAEILRQMKAVAEAGRSKRPDELFLQTKHLRYATRRWIQIDGAGQQWSDTRVDARRSSDDNLWHLRTRNVTRLELTADANGPQPGEPIVLDGTSIVLRRLPARLQHSGGVWSEVGQFQGTRKHPGLSGPIDDAFLDPFLVVVPSGKAQDPEVERWVRCELQNFRSRWAALMRGRPRVKLDSEVTQQDMEKYHLVLWGTPDSNQLLGRILESKLMQAGPIRWQASGIRVGRAASDSPQAVLLGIYPNPLSPEKYVVINSGPTFRQSHDRTNSLQNPHLGDWCILSVDTPPSGELPGRILYTGFFDDAWQQDTKLTW